MRKNRQNPDMEFAETNVQIPGGLSSSDSPLTDLALLQHSP